jgi:signal transduction histidine kinase
VNEGVKLNGEPRTARPGAGQPRRERAEILCTPSEPDGAERPPRIVLSTAREGNDLVLRVADNGVGVPEADRERVLQRFVRLEKSRSTAGSGLGLSLVNAVVAFHNGTIELSDNQPGLVVTLRLPIRQP